MSKEYGYILTTQFLLVEKVINDAL